VPDWPKQIGAVNLIVGDLERSKAFYRDIFGLPLQHEDEESAMGEPQPLQLNRGRP